MRHRFGWTLEQIGAAVGLSPGAVDGPRMDRVIAADAEARGLDPVIVRRESENQVSLRTFVKVINNPIRDSLH